MRLATDVRRERLRQLTVRGRRLEHCLAVLPVEQENVVESEAAAGLVVGAARKDVEPPKPVCGEEGESQVR